MEATPLACTFIGEEVNEVIYDIHDSLCIDAWSNRSYTYVRCPERSWCTANVQSVYNVRTWAAAVFQFEVHCEVCAGITWYSDTVAYVVFEHAACAGSD